MIDCSRRRRCRSCLVLTYAVYSEGKTLHGVTPAHSRAVFDSSTQSQMTKESRRHPSHAPRDPSEDDAKALVRRFGCCERVGVELGTRTSNREAQWRERRKEGSAGAPTRGEEAQSRTRGRVKISSRALAGHRPSRPRVRTPRRLRQLKKDAGRALMNRAYSRISPDGIHNDAQRSKPNERPGSFI